MRRLLQSSPNFSFTQLEIHTSSSLSHAVTSVTVPVHSRSYNSTALMSVPLLR